MKATISASSPIPPGILYLDYAATTPLAPEVLEAMMPFLTSSFGNASTLYSLGAECREAIHAARETMARFVGAEDPNEIVFTSGGTESDNAAIRGVLEANPGKRVVCSSIEHHAVLDTCKAAAGQRCVVVEVGPDGILDPDALRAAMPDDACLVSVMHANNEIGVIQPIRELAAIAHEAGAVFHTDAVQSAGKIPIDVVEMGIDLLSISAHKLYGPKGVGALYVKKGTPLRSQQTGGEQEHGRRGGTSNTPGIVGLAKAAELAMEEMAEESVRLRTLRDRLIDGVLNSVPDSRLTGAREPRLPHNAHFLFRGCEGESILLNLDHVGLCCSAGAACASGSVEMSHVLRALHIEPEWGQGSIRVSLGRYTTEPDIERAIRALASAVEQVRRLTTSPPLVT